MWLYVAGIERTLSQWQSLFNAADLEIVKIWQAKTGHESVIEVQKVHSDQDWQVTQDAGGLAHTQI